MVANDESEEIFTFWFCTVNYRYGSPGNV